MLRGAGAKWAFLPSEGRTECIERRKGGRRNQDTFRWLGGIAERFDQKRQSLPRIRWHHNCGGQQSFFNPGLSLPGYAVGPYKRKTEPSVSGGTPSRKACWITSLPALAVAAEFCASNSAIFLQGRTASCVPLHLREAHTCGDSPLRQFRQCLERRIPNSWEPAG